MPQARTEPGCSAVSLARGPAGAVAHHAMERHTRDTFLANYLSVFLGQVPGHPAWFLWVSFVGPHIMLWHQRAALMVLVLVW